MNSSPPPIIAFELGVGEFRIVTPEAVYQIKVCPDLVEAIGLDGPPAAAGPNGGDRAGTFFFKEISEELFNKVGRLARQLSVSVEELPETLSGGGALGDTGQRLESAKGQLEEIIDITEKASMNIMDSADEIQAQLDQLKNQLDTLQGLEFLTAPPEGRPPAQAPPAVGTSQAVLDKLAEINDFVDSLLSGGAPAEAASPPPPSPSPAPAAGDTLTVVHFDVNTVFQTLYELCTNEAVKDHIKLMREAQETAFNCHLISEKLTEVSTEVTEEDGFYNFPIASILKILHTATASEEYRTILKKMNQTAPSIFLDTVLPVEGEIMEIEAAPAAPPAVPAPEAPAPEAPAAETEPAPLPAGAGCSRAELEALRAMTLELEALARADVSAGAPAADDEEGEGGLYTSILVHDRDLIIQAVTQARALIEGTGGHLTRILETLSFQDLSGQRIKRVVSLIGDIQTELLSILVSVDTKFKEHQADQNLDVKSEKVEKMAQEEVDKALEKLAAGASELLGPGAESRLNQGAVNDLLAQLGF